jgi:2-phospho-L-lactate transferase/gluconeogenesis factor (CofD/UPF0052 family)
MNDIRISIISGGTATNELVTLFQSISSKISYIIPISDNGGSTSELIRVIGGPAIGDLRSRLTRLIPESHKNLRLLLSFRLSHDPTLAKAQWNEIVDGTHSVWHDINPATKEIIRAFLIHVHTELLKRSKFQFTPNGTRRQFRYELANVGNLFLTGIRLFIGSLDSAIELFVKLTNIDSNIEVLPCVNTNFSYHISALLENGLIITGQSQISHPSETAHHKPDRPYPPPIINTGPPSPMENHAINCDPEPVPDYFKVHTQLHQLELPRENNRNSVSSFISDVESESEDEEAGNVPQYTHPDLRKSQLHFSKSENIQPLLSPIKRIFYISPYGEEICPIAHSRASSSINNSDVLIYSIGSLMTSIIPVVILRNIGKAIAGDLSDNSKPKKKILLLNGCTDRETFNMTATDFIRVIFELAIYSLEKSKVSNQVTSNLQWKNVVTHLVYMKNPNIPVDLQLLHSKEIQCVEVERTDTGDLYSLQSLENELRSIIYD